MKQALAAARASAAFGDVPVGAVIVDRVASRILAVAGNRVEQDRDPTAHAELLAIRMAARELSVARLSHCDLYVTLEPCAMCAQAIAFARITRLFFGAYDPKGGGVEHGARIFSQPTCNHVPDVVGGLEEGECARLLREFFAGLR
ncbi:MAG: tRNA-specific adenosine deaminase [Alphaproteobacteria bacterium]|nr:tRNA-specific adenosine deaminase [Alphaproteobacteria bacterium]